MTLFSQHFIWDDIDFGDGCIRIKPDRIKTILLPIPFKGAMPSLNSIKQEYFVKNYNKPFKLVFANSILSKIDSPCWDEINELIEKAIEIQRFSNVSKVLNKRQSIIEKRKTIPRHSILSAHEKPDYLKILASLQSPRFKLITIREKYQGQSEESFIYRFETLSGRILIVWENTNASRAAYLFITNDKDMPEVLAKIEAFINTESIAFKRSRFQKLKANKSLKADLRYIGSVQHDNTGQFLTEIKTYMNRY